MVKHHELTGVDDLKPAPYNPREIEDSAAEGLAKSLHDFGDIGGITWNRRTGHLVCGHQRVDQLRGQGAQIVKGALEIANGERFPIRVVDWTEDKEKAANVVANNHLIAGRFTADIKEILPEIKLSIGDEDFGALNLDALADDLKKSLPQESPDIEEDEVPEPPKKPVTKLGDVWTLGDHRVVCGDCTDSANYTGNFALALTDPPYGLGGGKESGKNNYDEFDDTKENVQSIALQWLPMVRKMCRAVVFSPGVTRQWLYPEPDWVLCWFYGGGQLRSPWGFNCWQPFLCYGKDPSLGSGRGARPDAVNMNTPANAADIDHPCPKPLKLWAWLIERMHFDESQILDPFLGSGTTLIAAEQLGRKCYGVEISPAYCDVVIERWENLTGGEATRAKA